MGGTQAAVSWGERKGYEEKMHWGKKTDKDKGNHEKRPGRPDHRGKSGRTARHKKI